MTKLKRDKSRFYNYPPFLFPVKGKEIFEKKRIGLYIHIPFCERLCFFCPYTKYLSKKQKIIQYVSALKKEIKFISSQNALSNYAVSSVFFGGGTPSFLSAKQLTEILSFCRNHFVFLEGIQVTVEANPSSVDEQKLKQLKKAGFNRISFGIQSFNDKLLKKLGTAHDSVKAVNAVNLAKNYFNSINLDLMYALPEQTLSDWQTDLIKATKLKVSHLTTYALDVVPGTVFFALKERKILGEIPSFEKEKEMLFLSDKILGKKGFKRYLIDQFALKGKESSYAKQTLSGEVIGLGCGAFSHFNDFEFRNSLNLEKYLEEAENGFAVEAGKKLTKKEQMERFMIKGLLSLEINSEIFKEKFGVELNKVFGKQITFLSKEKMISVKKNKINVLPEGRLYIYNLCRQFYSEENNGLMKEFEKNNC